jgi:hypothetical protein
VAPQLRGPSVAVLDCQFQVGRQASRLERRAVAEGDAMKRIINWLFDPDNNGTILLAVLIFCAACVVTSFALVTP